MNNLEEMKKKYEELGEAIKRLEEQEQPAEWPQVGDEYWTGLFPNRIEGFFFDNDVAEAFYKAIGDMHRTKEEAEAYRAFRMNPRTVMRDKIQVFVDEYNGNWVADWNSAVADCKWFVNEDGKLDFVRHLVKPFQMKDREGAKLLLEKFGHKNILWACGGPEPEE